VLGMAITLRNEGSGDLVPVRARVSFLLQNIMTALGAETAHCAMGTGVQSVGKATEGLNFTSHFHLVGS
jgi:hypothetical protein